MPGRYRKHATKRKRRRRRKRKKTNMGQVLSGLPTTMKFRYCDVLQLDPSAGVVSKHQFRANSLFDPDSTGTGHQPKGFDQWTPFWNHYIVTGSKITVQFTGSGSNQPGSVFGVGIVPTTGGLGSTPAAICENNIANWQVAGLSANDSMKHSITAYYSAKNYFNITDVKDNVDRLGAAITANPAEDVLFEVFFGALDATVNPVLADILVTIEYTASFSEPKILAQS